MIKIPKIRDKFEFENNFYLTCDNDRISKLLIQYELFSMAKNIPGEIVECGVFKGVSLIRFASFVKIFEKKIRKIYAFDAFGKFPSTGRKEDILFS